MTVRTALLAAALTAVAGCGLPLDGGVRAPGPVAGEQRGPGDIRVLPPGPRDGMSPEDVVRGFLGAQSNPDGAHAIARQFLVEGTQWDDRAGVQVYDPLRRDVRLLAGGSVRTVRVRAPLLGLIDARGSYRPVVAGTRWLDERYTVRQEGSNWRLIGVPAGLQLSTADRDRSFRARQVHFLAPQDPGEAQDRLVADPLFVPVDLDQSRVLVERLLRGPSAALAGSVGTAVPPGTRLLDVRQGPPGTVVIDLSGEIDSLGLLQRQQLSAQLIWTLRSQGPAFARLRLLAAGRPYDVPGTGTEQDADEWSGYDPDGLQPGAGAYYVAERRLRSLESVRTDPDTTPPAVVQPPVDVAAVAPTADQQAGLLSRRPDGTWDVLTGTVGGVFERRLSGPRLRSPSWGSGIDGLWLLQAGDDAGRDPVLLLIPPTGQRVVVPVDLAGIPAPTAIRVSRDGARMAMVADGRVYVGRIQRSGGRVRVNGLQFVSPGLAEVSQLTWGTGTSLVVLARNGGGNDVVLPFRVAVDGSAVALLGRPGLAASLRSAAAAPGRPLLVGAQVQAAGALLFRDNGRLFEQLPVKGTEPIYPG